MCHRSKQLTANRQSICLRHVNDPGPDDSIRGRFPGEGLADDGGGGQHDYQPVEEQDQQQDQSTHEECFACQWPQDFPERLERTAVPVEGRVWTAGRKKKINHLG